MRKPLSPARLIAALVLIVVIAAVAVLVPARGSDANAAVPPLLAIEEGGLRYEYHLPTGMEALFETSTDAGSLQNLVETRPDEARRLRAKLSRKHDVVDIEELREHYKETTETLRGLGYL